MPPFPLRALEIALAVAGAVGLLVLIAPSFGRKPKATPDGWQFPVKPTCLLLYWLGFASGLGAVAVGARQLLASGTSIWAGWALFAFGFGFVLLVLADWPEPLVLDRQGLAERGSKPCQLHWAELRYVRQYRIRYDRGVVIHGVHDKQLVVADIVYDSSAVLDCLLQRSPVPFYSLKDGHAPLSILGETQPVSRQRR